MSELAFLLIEMIFPRHSLGLLKPGHQCSGTAIGSPTRLSAHSGSYGNTGDGIVAWAWRSVASTKAMPIAERRRFSMG